VVSGQKLRSHTAPAPQRILVIEPLGDVGAVLLEDLDAVVGSVADIDEAVARDLGACTGLRTAGPPARRDRISASCRPMAACR